ncbi:MAG: GtrA family protein [Bacilli bacterium]|nr:GtrA family protein [Bacilli bacterium]
MINKIKELFKYQQIRFLFVGGLNTIVGYGSFALLLLTGMNYLLANTISYIIGVIHSYIWNRKFTFKSKNKSILELIKFVSVYVVNYLIGLGSLYILVDILKIDKYLAGALNLVITTLISWFGHKYFSFRQKGEKNV